MADQGGANETGKQGHYETNKVLGEREAITSQTATTSGGAAELSPLDRDPEARGDLDPGNDQGGPSMATRVADPGRRGPEDSSYMPGGDKTSQPELKTDDVETVRGGRDENPRQFHERQPRD